MTSPRMATAVRALVAEDRQLEFSPDVHGGVDRAARKQVSRGVIGTQSHHAALTVQVLNSTLLGAGASWSLNSGAFRGV